MPVVLSDYRPAWSRFEIGSLIGLPLVPLVTVLLVAEQPSAYLLVVLGVVGSGLLWFLGRHRKREGALTVVDDDGTWRLRSGTAEGVTRGSYVAVADVNDVSVITRGPVVDLALVVLGADGTQEQSLRLPKHLLDRDPALRAEVRAVVEAACGQVPADADALLAA